MSDYTDDLQTDEWEAGASQALRTTARRIIDEAARKLYDACPTPKPRWEQLGDVTKGVWRERAVQGFTPTPPALTPQQN